LDKKKLAILITIITISTILSGCIENNNNGHEIIIKTKNLAPIPIINAPEKAFFEELIEFDASNSYDPDGEIKKYEWDLGDNNTLSGNTITPFSRLFTRSHLVLGVLRRSIVMGAWRCLRWSVYCYELF